MVIGSLIGIGGLPNKGVEKIISFSVILIGLLYFLNLKKYSLAILPLVALIGGFHGYAHGIEMPETTTIFKYISGFVIGAVLLTTIGYFINIFLINKITKKHQIYHAIAIVLIVSGLYFLFR
jgi:urease accessory protein